MSYDIDLIDENGKPYKVDKFCEGETQVLGGSTESSLNITYNYSKFYDDLDEQEGIHWLHNKKAETTIIKLKATIKKLGTNKAIDYWAAIPGNAGFALSILLKWAEQYPDGIFKVC